jgi:serine/threonine-protein phosphatase 6 regulatory subunit 3
MLMVRKPHEMTSLMNKHSEKFLKGFIRHTKSYSIAELFKRLLQPFQADYLEDGMDFSGIAMSYPSSNTWYGGREEDEKSVSTPTSTKEKSLIWQQDHAVIDLLVANLAPNDTNGNPIDCDIQKHSAEILVDLVHCGTRAQQGESSASPRSIGGTSSASFVLLEYLESKEIVEKIISLAIPESTMSSIFCSSSMTSSLSVLSSLLSRHTNTRYSTSEDLPAVVALTIDRLPQLCTTLKGKDHDAGTIINQRHQEVPRLGLRRLKLVGLVVLLTQSKYTKVDLALFAENAIEICLDLFFQFESVNMLHADIENMIVGILEAGSKHLLIALIQKANLLNRILEAYEKNKQAISQQQPKGFALGYMGHLYRICHMIIVLMDELQGTSSGSGGGGGGGMGRGSIEGRGSLNDMAHADSVMEMLEADPSWGKWVEFSSNVLAPLFEKERLPLGGIQFHGGSLPGGEEGGPDTSDPYGMMNFDHNEQILNSHFAQMLEQENLKEKDLNDPFARDFDLPSSFSSSHHTTMLPEIIHDSSSSSSDEENDLSYHARGHRGIHEDEEDDFDFDPRAGRMGMDEPTSPPPPPARTYFADFEKNDENSWANFGEQTTDATNSIEASSFFANFEETTSTTTVTQTSTTTFETTFDANFSEESSGASSIESTKTDHATFEAKFLEDTTSS